MLRRDFLKALAFVAAAAAVPSMATPVIQPVINPHQKYIDALALFDAVVLAKANNADATEMNKHCCTVMSFVMDNFARPVDDEETVEQIKHLLNTTSIGSAAQCKEQIRKVPPDLAEAIWPIALTKALLADERITMNPKMNPAFAEFIEVYKPLIIR